MWGLFAIALVLADSRSPPLYPELGQQYDLKLPLVCSYTPCLAPMQPREESPVEKERRQSLLAGSTDSSCPEVRFDLVESPSRLRLP